MPNTYLRRDKTKLWNEVNKIKFLQNFAGSSKAIIIPGSWLETLGWDNKALIMGFDVLNNQIIIRKFDGEVKRNEKAGKPFSE
jgi:hypothetical protein